MCCEAVKKLFKQDKLGQASLGVIKVISGFVKGRNYEVRPEVSLSFLTFVLRLFSNYVVNFQFLWGINFFIEMYRVKVFNSPQVTTHNNLVYSLLDVILCSYRHTLFIFLNKNGFILWKLFWSCFHFIYCIHIFFFLFWLPRCTWSS